MASILSRPQCVNTGHIVLYPIIEFNVTKPYRKGAMFCLKPTRMTGSHWLGNTMLCVLQCSSAVLIFVRHNSTKLMKCKYKVLTLHCQSLKGCLQWPGESIHAFYWFIMYQLYSYFQNHKIRKRTGYSAYKGKWILFPYTLQTIMQLYFAVKMTYLDSYKQRLFRVSYSCLRKEVHCA